MAAYSAGDPRAFEQLLERLGPRLHGFFLRSFENQALADDLMQVTLLKLHRARHDYRMGLPVRPWVFSIAARVRFDEYRRRRRAREQLEAEPAAAVASPGGGAYGAGDEDAGAGSIEAKRRVAQVREALAALPESQRVIVHMHRYEGLTFAQIAAALGTTEGAVKLRAFRAYERLRKALAPLLGGGTEGST